MKATQFRTYIRDNFDGSKSSIKNFTTEQECRADWAKRQRHIDDNSYDEACMCYMQFQKVNGNWCNFH